MKKSALFTTVLLMAMAISVSGIAQIINPASVFRRKAEQKVNQKIEEGVDKAVDKAMTPPPKKEGSTSNSEDPEAAVNNFFKNLDMGGTPKASYDFTSSMIMKMTIVSSKEKKNSTMKSKYMFSQDGSAMATKFISNDNPDMAKASESMDAMVFDFTQKKMFTFMNNKGSKTVMAIGFKGDAMEKYAEKENSKMTITKTSQTKTIAGYLCDGYLMDNNGEKMTMWISRDRVPEIARLAQKMSQGSNSPYGGQKSKGYGAYYAHPELVKIAEEGRMTMGYTAVNSNGDETNMELEEIKANDPSTFKTADYKPMMGGGKP
jgi:hypothetical protein